VADAVEHQGIRAVQDEVLNALRVPVKLGAARRVCAWVHGGAAFGRVLARRDGRGEKRVHGFACLHATRLGAYTQLLDLRSLHACSKQASKQASSQPSMRTRDTHPLAQAKISADWPLRLVWFRTVEMRSGALDMTAASNSICTMR